MLSNWFIMLPEILLTTFILIAGLINHCRNDKTPKTFFTMAQVFIAAVLVATVVFYNKSVFPEIWINTPFTTLFKSGAYLLAWAWLYMSSKWFLNKNRPSCVFCCIIFAQLAAFDILASAVSLFALSAIIPLILALNTALIMRHWDIERVKPLAVKYICSSLLFTALLISASVVIYQSVGSADYSAIKQYLSSMNQTNIRIYAAIAAIVSVFMFLLGMAPFHIWLVSFVSRGVLPVCGFITLVPPLIYFCALINLIREGFAPLSGFIEPIILGFAFISIIIGALSADGEKNIRSLFAYLSIYCLGFCLAGIADFNASSITASFAYIVAMMLSFAGIYTVFLGLKSHSEYLSDIDSLRGFSAYRPFMSAALMVFMFSFVGLAPALGFFGYVSVLNNLVASTDWVILLFLIGGMLLASRACLKIIQTIYFEQAAQNYDRVDKSIYICLFINIAMILSSLINPNWLLHDAFVILGGSAL